MSKNMTDVDWLDNFNRKRTFAFEEMGGQCCGTCKHHQPKYDECHRFPAFVSKHHTSPPCGEYDTDWKNKVEPFMYENGYVAKD